LSLNNSHSLQILEGARECSRVEIVGLSLSEKIVEAHGSVHQIVCKKDPPFGAELSYSFDDRTDVSPTHSVSVREDG